MAKVDKELLQKALRAWVKTDVLNKSPLVDLEVVITRSTIPNGSKTAERGHVLRMVLRDAIDQLTAQGPEKYGPQRAKQFITILQEQYIQQHTTDYVADLLSIAKPTYFRLQNDAVTALANVIEQMNVDTLHLPSASVIAPLPNYDCFIGRDSLMTRIRQVLQPSMAAPGEKRRQCLGLWGLPGVGKTTVLIQLANDPEIRILFPDGILWASIGEMPDLTTLINQWATALNIPMTQFNEATTLVDKVKLIHTAIGNRRILFILDDVWNAGEVLPLKIQAANAHLLFTTRFPDVAAALAGPSIIQVNELSVEESLNVLRSYAPYAIQDFPDRALNLVECLGGLPLALVITGQFLQKASFAAQPRRVQMAFEKMESALFRLSLQDKSVVMHGLESAQRTLDAVIGQSVEMLSREARSTLACLSSLPCKPTTFSEDAALQIAETYCEVLDELVNFGLLETVINDGSRYALHQSVVDYTQTHITDADNAINSLRRIVHFYAEQIEKYDAETISADMPNILFAAREAHKHGYEADLIRLVMSVYPYLDSRALWSSAVELLNLILEVKSVRRQIKLHADVLLKLTHCYLMQRQYQHAEAFAHAATIVISKINSPELHCQVLNLQANIAFSKGEYPSAAECCKQALEAASQAQSNDLTEQAQATLAVVLTTMGEWTHASDLIERTNDENLLNRVQQRASLALCQFNAIHSMMHYLHARVYEAEARMRVSLNIARKIRNSKWTIDCLAGLGWLTATMGKFDESVQLVNEGISLSRGTDISAEGVGYLHCNLGLVAHGRGMPDQAESHIQDAIAIAHSALDSRTIGFPTLLATFARVQVANQHFEEALATCRRVLSITNNHLECIPPLAIMGYIYCRKGEKNHSESLFAEALGRGKRMGLINSEFVILFLLHYQGESDLFSANYERAFDHFALADKIAQKTRSPLLMGITSLGLARSVAACGHTDKAKMYAKASFDQLSPIGHAHAAVAHNLWQSLAQNSLFVHSELAYAM